ncbi:hypothetical protein B1C78_08215 [Thioalkalivibrio denitrificans]|uniref:Uncharacterized protein n=1 Tax=Thioalkalivibrio denitrificans TaxID=108003 RepID=A0A1V3NJ54_9GAMM|nr:hypothetical protein [Thioalkalivibrio denitrificans]OOG24796.1 hypothetical protein B1C78_08215 [Thioalkalivibrio denitrificans]
MSFPEETRVPPLSEQAIIVEGRTLGGRVCRLVDNTGTVERALLDELLSDLLEAKRFGLAGRSATGASTIRLGAPEFTHIQLGGQLYRLILFSHEARLEAF